MVDSFLVCGIAYFSGVNLANCALVCEVQIGKQVTRKLFYRYLRLVNQKCICVFEKHLAEL